MKRVRKGKYDVAHLNTACDNTFLGCHRSSFVHVSDKPPPSPPLLPYFMRDTTRSILVLRVRPRDRTICPVRHFVDLSYLSAPPPIPLPTNAIVLRGKPPSIETTKMKRAPAVPQPRHRASLAVIPAKCGVHLGTPWRSSTGEPLALACPAGWTTR